MKERTEALKVVVIMGMTRSGSTLLDNLLGAGDGFFSTGELHYIWERGLVEHRRCGCGRQIDECEIWSRVLAVGFGDPLSVDPHELSRIQHRVARLRHTWRLLRSDHRSADSPEEAGYISAVARLYKATSDITGARVIVDSSKRPSDAAVTSRLSDLNPYFIHLVRDPRAVAFSWSHTKKELDSETAEHMPRLGTARSSLQWVAHNLAAQAVRKRFPDRSILIRYEDLVRDPGAALQQIFHLVNEGESQPTFSPDGVIKLPPNHTVSGNPSRFDSGEVKVRADERWRSRQAPLERFVATTVTLPLLFKYRYRVRPGSGSPTTR